MNYIDTTTLEYPITPDLMRARHPDTLFPEPFEPLDRYAPVPFGTVPAHDAATHKAVEIAPVEQDGQWLQQWEVVPLTAEEIEAARIAALPLVPDVCTPAQGLVALYVLKSITESDITTALAQIPDHVQRYTAQIGYSRATEWRMDSPTMQGMAVLLSLSQEDLEALFTYAVGVTV